MQDIPPTQFMDLRSFLAPAVACAVSACAVKLLHMSNEFGEQIVCNHPKNYHKYALDFYIFAMGSLCCFVTVQSLRVFSLNGKSERFDDVRRVAIAALTISIIQLGTTYSDYNNPLGCINSFG